MGAERHLLGDCADCRAKHAITALIGTRIVETVRSLGGHVARQVRGLSSRTANITRMVLLHVCFVRVSLWPVFVGCPLTCMIRHARSRLVCAQATLRSCLDGAEDGARQLRVPPLGD